MDQKPKLYIAYGSNMNIEQMARRCPTAKVVGTAELEDWRLRFKGDNNFSVATVEPSVGHRVPILVWEIMPKDEASLDVYEGYPRLYRKEMMLVRIEKVIRLAMIYIMNADDLAYGNPSDVYYDTIRTGYINAGFSPDLLEQSVIANMKKEGK